MTTYKAVKISGARSSDLVAVFGAGGLGHLAIQYAAITGAAVVDVDVNPERLEAARALGAEHVVHDLSVSLHPYASSVLRPARCTGSSGWRATTPAGRSWSGHT